MFLTAKMLPFLRLSNYFNSTSFPWSGGIIFPAWAPRLMDMSCYPGALGEFVCAGYERRQFLTESGDVTLKAFEAVVSKRVFCLTDSKSGS